MHLGYCFLQMQRFATETNWTSRNIMVRRGFIVSGPRHHYSSKISEN